MTKISAINKPKRKTVKKAERRKKLPAKTENERAELLYEIIPSGIFMVDAQKRITSWNKKASEITGYSKEEIIGKKCSIFAEAPCKERCGLFDKSVSKPVIQKECVIKNKNGESRFISKNANILKDSNGNIIGGIESFEDIMAQKSTEEKLRVSEEKFRSMIESTSDWVWEVDANGVYVYASPKVYDILGYKPEDVLGKTPFNFMAPGEAKRVPKIFSSVAGQKKSFNNLENANIHKTGKEIMLETSGVPIFDNDGNLRGYRGIDRDITERKKTETELEKHKDRLEELVKERTAELEAEITRHELTEKRLKISNIDLEHFAHVVSHDLRTPLGLMMNSFELLQARNKHKFEKEDNDIINNGIGTVTHMAELVNDVLEYSIAGGKTELKRVSCEETLKDVTLTLKSAIDENKAAISHGPLPVVTGSKSLMRQLFQNLISNAIKFRAGAPPKIHISAEKKEGEWQFCVKDNGIGIKPEHKELIFSIFMRLHKEGKYPGAGIGLAACRKIVERHGGRIWVESKQGKGSTFYFTVPA